MMPRPSLRYAIEKLDPDLRRQAMAKGEGTAVTKEYQNRLALLLDELNLELGSHIELQVKPFFGGAAAYANGNICLSLTKVGFAVKLPLDDRKALLNQGGRPLRYFPKAPIKKEYVILPNTVMNEPDSLRQWVRKCIHTVTSKDK